MKRDAWARTCPEQREQIITRIREAGRDYAIGEQRAELLFRNHFFVRTLRNVQKWNAWAKAGRGTPKWVGSEWEAASRFRKMCDRWQIKEGWNLKKETLPEFLKMRLEAFCAAPGVWSSTPYPGSDRQECLYIRIDPWTKREDIEAAWGRIEKLKKKIFGYSEKDKDSFGQILCWYDLKKEYHLSPLSVARLWIQEAAPHIRNEESFKITVREGIKRIERYIRRLTPSEELPRK